MGILLKIARYSRETRACFILGADWKSAFALAAATLQFHFFNGFKIGQQAEKENPRCFRIKLGQHKVDVWLRCKGGDLFVFHEAFLDRCYRIPTDFQKITGGILDLGAHIGLTTLFLAEQFPHASSYVCVEPDPANLEILRRNVSWLGNRVTVVAGAVSDHSGEEHFDSSGRSWEGKLVPVQAGGVVVRCYSMEEIMTLCGLDNIAILKVDVEGAEKRIFETGAQWLQKVGLIIIELHAGYSVDEFEKRVKPHGFRVFLPDLQRENRMILAAREKFFNA